MQKTFLFPVEIGMGFEEEFKIARIIPGVHRIMTPEDGALCQAGIGIPMLGPDQGRQIMRR
jgi:hypothetical protein